mgnify:CR=1 FL=1
MKNLFPCIMLFLLVMQNKILIAQPLLTQPVFTRQDTLRGSIGEGRYWWDVMFYDITVKPDFMTKTINGNTIISFKVIKSRRQMQLDLQLPLQIDSILLNKVSLHFTKDGNVAWVDMPKFKANSVHQINIFYHGRPHEASNPPWNGGWIWKTDQSGNPWMSVACQGLGASVWYPCKDHQSDEPDQGALLSIIASDSLQAIGNGRLISHASNLDGTTVWKWKVSSPINNYDIIPYIGQYSHWSDSLIAENNNVLSCDYWVLNYNLAKAKDQFSKNVHPMIKAFEYWFGPYPFAADGFKLVESPHLGMEHQSDIGYGNQFQNGYRGRDLSGTGWGMKWDFIIIHESGHEWFGNNITTKDVADMWVHESFTAYSETLFTQFYFGIEAGNDYVIGTRKNIKNDKPVIGPYGVNQEGSGDMYYKGSNMLHTIRHIADNDSLFRMTLRKLNQIYYHKTVTGAEVERFMSKNLNKNLSKIFDQYLRTNQIPLLEYQIKDHQLQYRWTNCVQGFDMPLQVRGCTQGWLYPSEKWKSKTLDVNLLSEELTIDRNFFATVRKV